MMGYIVGFVLILLGIYSIATTRDLVRMLISLELVTVGGFAMFAAVSLSNPTLALYGVLILVMISVSEVAVLAALVYRNYLLTRRVDVSSIATGEP